MQQSCDLQIKQKIQIFEYERGVSRSEGGCPKPMLHSSAPRIHRDYGCCIFYSAGYQTSRFCRYPVFFKRLAFWSLDGNLLHIAKQGGVCTVRPNKTSLCSTTSSLVWWNKEVSLFFLTLRKFHFYLNIYFDWCRILYFVISILINLNTQG